MFLSCLGITQLKFDWWPASLIESSWSFSLQIFVLFSLSLPETPITCEVKVAQLCPTLCDSMDCSLPGSSVHVILQARILEWGAISLSRGSSRPRDWTLGSCIGRWILCHWATWEIQVFLCQGINDKMEWQVWSLPLKWWCSLGQWAICNNCHVIG